MKNVVGAYVLSAVVLGGYALSLVLRTRRAKQRSEADLEREG
ncbi:MAG: hypothetical protein WCL38_00375 [Actinomycetota bacterium]